MALVGALVLLSLLGSTISLYRITEVSRSLDSINRVSMPLGRLLAQMQSDAGVFKREAERRLGNINWSDSHWRARPMPKWIHDLIEQQLGKASELFKRDFHWASSQERDRWTAWLGGLTAEFRLLREEGDLLFAALDRRDEDTAIKTHSRWMNRLDEWIRHLHWGVNEYEISMRRSFSAAEARVAQLRMGLEIILVVVVGLSLLLLWFGERALRPLHELTTLAREITRRGLRREDKARLDIPVSRDDEVSQLAREFHRMATSLLEREKTVETQNQRLQEQNRQLREMGELQERLRRAEHLAAIGRMSAQVAHEIRNPLHSIGLEAEMAHERAEQRGDRLLKQSLQSILVSVDRLEKITENYLKLSRLSTGERQPIDIGEVLEEVLATYASALEAEDVHVDWSRAGDVPLLTLGDRDLLEQAVGNLLRNSLQALAERDAKDCVEGEQSGARIVLGVGYAESGRVWLRIEDNGPGVPPDVRDRLFTPFVTTKAQGTGLGLSFVKKVVEDHGGTVRYADSQMGGACFEVALPPYVPSQVIETRPDAAEGVNEAPGECHV